MKYDADGLAQDLAYGLVVAFGYGTGNEPGLLGFTLCLGGYAGVRAVAWGVLAAVTRGAGAIRYLRTWAGWSGLAAVGSAYGMWRHASTDVWPLLPGAVAAVGVAALFLLVMAVTGNLRAWWNSDDNIA